MSKISLTDLVNLENQTTAVSAINTNNATLEAAIDNTLSRDGSFPNQMQANLDMNSNRILNLPLPTTSEEPLRVIDADFLTAGGTINVFSTLDYLPETYGAKGDGVTDDAPAFRLALAAIASAGGGRLLLGPKTYLMGTTQGGTAAILSPSNNLTIEGCGDKSILKAANGMNTGSAQYFFIYPIAAGAAYPRQNLQFKNFKLDFNGANNGGFNYNNVGIGGTHWTNVLIDNVTFYRNPGSQNISIGSALTSSAIRIRNTTHEDCGDVINASCTDHSSIYMVASDYSVIGNSFRNTVGVSTKATAIELHGLNGVCTNNVDDNYAKSVNIAAQAGHPAVDIIYSDNISFNSQRGVCLWNDAISSLQNITISNNIFRQGFQHSTEPYFNFDYQLTAVGAKNVLFKNNIFYSDVAAGTASTVGVMQVGRIANLEIKGNTFENGLGPAITLGSPGTVAASTSVYIEDNNIIDCGRTSTAGSRRGILLSSGTTIDTFTISNNRIENVASAYMTTGIDVNVNTTYGYIYNNNYISNVASFASAAGTGYNVGVTNSIPYSGAGISAPYIHIQPANGAILNSSVAGVPAMTATPVLGVAGTTVGSIGFRNATSGSITFQPTAGALGSSILTLPAVTGVLATTTSTVATVKKQTFTGSGTYTPSTGMLYCIVEAIGGGGGGAGCAGSATGVSSGGGGGAGGYSRILLSAATIGASKAVVIGASGAGGSAGANNGSAGTATTLGATLCIANGGSGGVQNGAGVAGSGGAGAIPGTGDIAINGNGGGAGNGSAGGAMSTLNGMGGIGGVGFFGGTPATAISNGSPLAGAAATANSGAGGSGGCVNVNVTGAAGGAGGSGYMIITEFCNQ